MAVLEKDFYLLDGGLSNAIKKLGGNVNNQLWTADLIHHQEEVIKNAHLNYLKSGAEIIISSSYQASIKGFMEKGFSHEVAIDLLKKTTEIAQSAKEEYREISKREVFIAGSIGPYAAYLADGSEYKGYDEAVDENTLRSFHNERLRIIDATDIDVLAVETIPSLEEAKVLNDLIEKCGHKAWFSFSCKNEKQLNDGTDIIDIVSLLKHNNNVMALGINCTHPKYILGLISEILNAGWKKKIVIYPNAGMVYNPDTKTWLGTSSPEDFLTLALQWKEAGANIIGGCCEISEEHIHLLHKRLVS
ncbi:homocysteine S-methyltransferase [Flammeovirga sp. MY04]|uniref:homocysteine S-methyltransferase n=1 Tax=Flammeovirga sp. MY04 TaxID=1191459 RepID=UPI0008062955|nr:homocysteine S-methyltransferase [Flammeovirga sp. MY04]ANQ47806.1 homocysteine S-methyltransferase [Flammeovirga sp. MY04]